MSSVADVAWPSARAAEALLALARAARLPSAKTSVPPEPPEVDATPERFARWVELSARWLGLEAEPIAATYADIDPLLRACGPSLLRLPDAPPERCLVALLGGRGRQVRVVAPDLSLHAVHTGALRAGLISRLELQFGSDVDAVVAAAGVAERRRPRVRAALLRSRLAPHAISGAWLLRPPPSAPFGAQLAGIHAARRGLVLLLAHALAYGLAIAGWWLVGSAALQGRLDRGWVEAWALLLLTQIPLAVFVSASQAQLAIDLGALLKQRLLAGALQLPSERVRSQGAGQLFGRVLESEAVEALAHGPGYLCMVSLIELFAALVVLGLGASAPLEIALLIGWLAGSALIGLRYYRERGTWTAVRIGLTHDLIERMQGHRTRLAQLARQRWHDGEDAALADYVARSARLDAWASTLGVLVPRGWLVLGVAGFALAFAGDSASPGALATTLGGVVLAYRALHRFVLGGSSLAGAAIAWREVAPLFRAAADVAPAVAPDVALGRASLSLEGRDAQRRIEARELVFRYRDTGPVLLRGCSLQIHPGDQIVLEGASGGGKSTLASILCGLRAPEAGVLLAGGLDLKTLGNAEWRRRAVAAPQFHENHVLSASFAFNLLMGRQWPPAADDLRAAEDVCRELGLGELIAHMPCGLQQMVGETGWQLSHGEKSRLYVARALLADADLLMFDESFAALDPQTLERALSCVLRRSKSLVVIAHP